MAIILKQSRRVFREDPNRKDPFRLFTDVSRVENGVNPQQLNFDLRQLIPGQYGVPYHFHRHAEELFMIISGEATLRTPDGLDVVGSGDIIFFETGATGAHQLYNHTETPCVYLDVRTFTGYDVCEYPDSEKINFINSHSHSQEIFRKDARSDYFDGEENVRERWQEIENRSTC
jgi:uncharacterized cupin superfamily protein